MKLKSYEQIWKIETKIYSIGKIRLLIPISPIDAGYFTAILGIVSLLSWLLPFFGYIPVIPRFLILPYLGTLFLRRKKFDGKNPLRFVIGYLKHFPQKGQSFELFHTANKHNVGTQTHKLVWNCTARDTSPY